MAALPSILSDRYKRFRFRNFEPNIHRYESLAENGQSPDVMVVSCCDSRVAPETIFSALPGELFVVRNVANLVPPYESSGRYHGVSAALEFAVLNLQVKHILVLAHSGCGGVKACVERHAAKQTQAQFITNWMAMLDPKRESLKAGNCAIGDEEMQSLLEFETVRTSIANLRTFPCINALETRGSLTLHGAHFDIGTGALSVLDDQEHGFARLT